MNKETPMPDPTPTEAERIASELVKKLSSTPCDDVENFDHWIEPIAKAIAASHKSVEISDRCPGCGCSLFIGTGGWITCSGLSCKTVVLDQMIVAARQVGYAEGVEESARVADLRSSKWVGDKIRSLLTRKEKP